MSVVTSIILTTGVLDPEEIPEVERILATAVGGSSNGFAFVKVDHLATGGKPMEAEVWIAAANYLDWDLFHSMLASLAAYLDENLINSTRRLDVFVYEQGRRGFDAYDWKAEMGDD